MAVEVMRLDKSNTYFQVAASAVEWWTALQQPDGKWYVVNMYGREIKADGKRGKQVVGAAKQKQAQV